MAAEGRHKFPSTLGMATEERHKSLLLLVLDVYITGSALSALPVTPSEGTLQKGSRLVEAYRVVLRGPEAVQLDIQCIQGVLAVHFSDFDLAHHVCFLETGVIGGDVVLWIYSQSSAVRLGGGDSPSFSRFCSFFGSAPGA